MKRLLPLLLLIAFIAPGYASPPSLRFRHTTVPAPDLPTATLRYSWQILTADGHPFLIRVTPGFILPQRLHPIIDGLQFIAPVPPDGWIVRSMSNEAAPPKAVRWAGALPPEAKMGLGLSIIRNSTEIRIRQLDKPNSTLRINSKEELTVLLQNPTVWVVNGPRPRIVPANDLIRKITGANAVQDPPWNLSGNGVILGIWDEADVEHPDFDGRLTVVRPQFASEHATHVAGTMAGDGGNSDGRFRGLATKAAIISWDYADPAADLTDALNRGIQWANNSWVFWIANDQGNCDYLNAYDDYTAAYDDTVFSMFETTVGFSFAAGNMGSMADCGIANRDGYGSLPPPSTGKNGISVGSTDNGNERSYWSSCGPTEDGRTKPDIVALGCENPGPGYVTSTLPYSTYGGEGWCGTSMATPQATGAAALLLELAQKNSIIPTSAGIKALLIAGARDILKRGPDFRSGWGHLDVMASTAILSYGGFRQSRVELLDEPVEFEIEVSEGLTALEITLVWDDPAPATTAAVTLVNDLELRLISPDQTEHLPWTLDPDNPAQAATRGEDHLNNVEQVRVDNPAAGTWLVRVAAAQLLTVQPFALTGWILGKPDCDADGDRSPGAQCGGDDCNDADAQIHVAAPEICFDEIDQNCDGIADEGCDDSTPEPIPVDDDEEEEDEKADDSGGGCGC